MSVPDRVPGQQLLGHTHAITCSHQYSHDSFSELEALRGYTLHDVNKGKMTCHVGSWPMNHGEKQKSPVVVMPKCGEGGNEFARERSITRSVSHSRSRTKRSGRLTVCWFDLRCVCSDRRQPCAAMGSASLSNTAIHAIYSFTMGHNETSCGGLLNSRMASGLNNVRILDPPSNTMSLNCMDNSNSFPGTGITTNYTIQTTCVLFLNGFQECQPHN